MNFLHIVIFNIKFGSEFPLFSATRLEVSKIDHVVIGLRRKIFEMLPLLSPSILYHHILILLRLLENSESALRNSWHPGYGENIFVAITLLTWPAQVYNIISVGRRTKIYKVWTRNGGKNWGWCWKKWQEHSFFGVNAREVIAEYPSARLDELDLIKK